MPRAIDRKILQFTALLFIPLALVMNLLVFRISKAERDSRLNVLESLEMEHIETERMSIGQKIEQIRSDLNFLADLDAVKEFLLAGGELQRRSIESIFVDFSRNREIYDQVRLIGRDGMELVRVDARPDGAHSIQGKSLQDKSERSYFKDSMVLPAGTVYMSPFDLNVEHGRVEVPHVPMIRFGRKVVDEAGRDLGLVFLNYYGGDLFPERYEAREKVLHSFLLLNREGYFLQGEKPEDEWGFMFEGQEDKRLAMKDPEAWRLLQNGEKGQFRTASGLYSYVTFHPLHVLEQGVSGAAICPGRWFLAFFVPRESTLFFPRWPVFPYLFLGLGLTVLLGGLVFAVVRFFERERTQALVDPLTSLWNRRSFVERLDRLEGRLAGGGQACIALIDLGNFKTVNDQCGHHAGDEALVLTARALLAEVRTTDFVGRYGGDEFVILFPGLEAKEARRVMQRLADRVDAVQIPSCDSARVIADWGLVHYPSESSTMREALELADARMYERKRQRKLDRGLPLQRGGMTRAKKAE